MKRLLLTLTAIPLLSYPFAYANEVSADNTQTIRVKGSFLTRVKTSKDTTLSTQSVIVEDSYLVWVTADKRKKDTSKEATDKTSNS